MKALNAIILIATLAIIGTAQASHHKTGEKAGKGMPDGRQHSQECKEATGGKGKAMGKCRSEKAQGKAKKSQAEVAGEDQQSEAKKNGEKQREDNDKKGVKSRDGDGLKKSGRPEDRGDESDD
ncbi:hypothetical protein NOR51B_2056 [Luminiphilus syltensis NOR5-1B]|uniref:Uncharacterized protein n=1 Tax=Luminiphilus syltensis NOR5-1B TaxID=565045 RepID=B8KTV1_9GAMM|nr:hypothetical protein [Luminiphilus syltensis]EED36108.1 hypothetical protein NOR51B_2056 [Luminiphilus syltensis NOR5-1B]